MNGFKFEKDEKKTVLSTEDLIKELQKYQELHGVGGITNIKTEHYDENTTTYYCITVIDNELIPYEHNIGLKAQKYDELFPDRCRLVDDVFKHVLTAWKKEGGVESTVNYKFEPIHGILTIYTTEPSKLMSSKNGGLIPKYEKLLSKAVSKFTEVKIVSIPAENTI